MGFLPQMELGDTFWPSVLFREAFGFVPNLFRAQTLLPRVIEAEAKIVDTVLLRERALSRQQKECLLFTVAAANRNTYCVTAHWEMLRRLGMADHQLRHMAIDHRRAGLPRSHGALLDFGLKLTQHPTRVSHVDIETLRRHGFADEAILEAILTAALTDFVCTISEGLGASPDFRPRKLPAQRIPIPGDGGSGTAHRHGEARPYLRAMEISPETFPPFAFFQDKFGFIPNIFRAQTLRPDVVEAEADVVGTVLLTDDVLSRVQKERILLVVSAANLNTYCVAVHCELLRALGVPEDESDQIAVDHHHSGLSGPDTALLDFALKLSQHPTEVDKKDINGLRRHGFTDAHILEAVVMTGLTTFLNTLQMGLGSVPDFDPRRVFAAETTAATAVPEVGSDDASADADAGLVARVRKGDVVAFEELVRRHHQRIYRALMGLTGNAQDAEDGTQDAFLKAFERIGKFRGASKFSTWLTRIAINEGIQRLRGRKRMERLDDNGSKEEKFRPRQVRAWEDNPEQLYSRTEIRALVERALLKLPTMYRMVVILRDLEQLSTQEAAKALNLGIAALKSRLIRGRLMLREALAPHFIRKARRTARV